jgi:hypothetical protein
LNGLRRRTAVSSGGDDRQPEEQPCHYIARPSLANKRAQFDDTRSVVLQLKAPDAMSPRT